MKLEAKACQSCPTQCRLENRSTSILEALKDGYITRDQAAQRVSTMTQEARQIGCPQEEMLRIRWETQEKIDPRLAEADRKKNPMRTPKPPADPADAYFQERRENALQRHTYEQTASRERFGRS